jgi:AmmeMemoRadiSam system protein A
VLDDTTRRHLLHVARRALLGAPAEADPPGIAPGSFGGVFVSLHRRHPHELRGCMGVLDSAGPLAAAVARAAVAAGKDPRFSPVSADEAADLDIEISVLPPLEEARAEDVQAGRHGVCVSRGERRALLLPQVAVERGWDRETLLAEACLKAGLPADAWRHAATRVEVFTAEVFGDRVDTAPAATPA